MNVLALDGALGGFSCAAAREGRIVAVATRGGNLALERGLGDLRDVLEESKLRLEEVERIAVGVGPGGFTGLRIAVTYAKSLAAVWKRPLVAVSSFDLLEFGQSFDRVLTVVVGRPGVISARYRDGAQARRASGATQAALDDLLPTDAGGRPLDVVGAPKDVLQALAERGFDVRSIHPAVTPAASAAALAAASRDPARSPHAVSADYGELPAAKVREP